MMSEHRDWWELDLEDLAEKLYNSEVEYWQTILPERVEKEHREIELSERFHPEWVCLSDDERGVYISMAETVSREMHQDEPSEFGCIILVSRNVGGILNNLREFRGYTSIDHVLLDLLNKALHAEQNDDVLGEVVQTIEELKEMIEERLKG